MEILPVPSVSPDAYRLLLDQAAATRAAELDAAAATVRNRLAKAAPVQNANPLGAALEALLGACATVLTAWQQAIVAAVFELCLVGVMVIFELLGQRTVAGSAPLAVAPATGDQFRSTARATPSEPAPATKRRTKKPKVSGRRLVRTFFQDYVHTAPGARVEVKSITRDIRAWSSAHDLVLPETGALLDEIAAVCRERGIDIEVSDDQRVHCLGVRLTVASLPAVH